MKLPILIGALMGLAVFTSCNRESSDTVAQDRIYTVYELYYNANEDKTFARATFRFSSEVGTKLELAGQSEVSFNGELLTFNRALAYYEREYSGLINSGEFTWVDTEGETYKNSVSINMIEYASGIDTIDRSASYELFWQGDPLSAGENVTVTINGEDKGDARIFVTNDEGANSIVLGKNLLEQVGQGPGTVFMDRNVFPGLMEETSAGGRISGRYRPENLEVYME